MCVVFSNIVEHVDIQESIDYSYSSAGVETITGSAPDPEERATGGDLVDLQLLNLQKTHVTAGLTEPFHSHGACHLPNLDGKRFQQNTVLTTMQTAVKRRTFKSYVFPGMS